MSRRRRRSTVLTKADMRAACLRAINPHLDLGYGVTLDAYTHLREALRAQISAYNTALSTLDGLSIQIKETETLLSDLSSRMLLGIAAKYGKDSLEYELAGGVRRSKRSRSRSRKAPKPAALPEIVTSNSAPEMVAQPEMN
jgi:hypothetical protein